MYTYIYLSIYLSISLSLYIYIYIYVYMPAAPQRPLRDPPPSIEDSPNHRHRNLNAFEKHIHTHMSLVISLQGDSYTIFPG